MKSINIIAKKSYYTNKNPYSKTGLFIFMILTIVSFNINPSFALSKSELYAESAIVIDGTTGDVLFEKNSSKVMYPASTTKILTALIILENHELDEIVTIDAETPFTEGSRIYVLENEKFTVEQLVNALLIQSANDAAVALAKHHSGSVEAFADEMNKKALDLGAKKTNFTNPNGLPDENHVTTAYDMAQISRGAMANSKFREIVNTVRYQIPPTNEQEETRFLKNGNRFLHGTGSSNKIDYRGETIDIKYDIVDGVKTGYTNAARQCLVTSAKVDNRRLIAVVLKSEGRNLYTDSRALLDYGFENFKNLRVIRQDEVVTNIKIHRAENNGLDLLAEDTIIKMLPNSYESQEMIPKLDIYEPIELPIEEGQIMGKVSFYVGDEFIAETNLLADHSIYEKNLFTSISDAFNQKDKPKDLKYWIGIIAKLVLTFIIWRVVVTAIRIRKKKNREIGNRRHETRDKRNGIDI